MVHTNQSPSRNDRTKLTGPTGHGWDIHEFDAACTRLAAAVPHFCYGGGEFNLISCRADRSPGGTAIKPHRHSYHEIILIIAGDAREMSPPGEHLGSGTIQVHGAGAMHAWTASRQGLLRMAFALTVQPTVAVRLPSKWPHLAALAKTVQELLAETVSTAPGRRERLEARLVLLLAPALALFDLPEEPLPPSPRVKPMARDIASFVERFLVDNLAEPLALDDVAAQLNVSVPTLSRRFRQSTGSSVIARLQDLRLQRAADLLRTSTRSVKQVASEVGIPEPSYFCRCFRHAFGCSPRRYATGLQNRDAGCSKSS